jgi:hypothetical protein
MKLELGCARRRPRSGHVIATGLERRLRLPGRWGPPPTDGQRWLIGCSARVAESTLPVLSHLPQTQAGRALLGRNSNSADRQSLSRAGRRTAIGDKASPLLDSARSAYEPLLA